MKEFDPIELTIFSSRLNAVCDEMGAQLRRAAFSPNIRDRLDFSCAVFDTQGLLCAQAAHIPVHLGSMAYAMKDIVSVFDWQAGDIVILNDPFKGGTHLPDVTFVAPIFYQDVLQGFVANRAHHADIGASSPGSMPISASIHEEGVLISPRRLYQQGMKDEEWYQSFLSRLRHPDQGEGDFNAQVSSLNKGLERLNEVIAYLDAGKDGGLAYQDALGALNHYATRLSEHALSVIPTGEYEYQDQMDSDGQGGECLPIHLKLSVNDHESGKTQSNTRRIHLDFTGSADQVKGNINCPLPVVAAAVMYVFRCLMPETMPVCDGAFRQIVITVPKGSMLNAQYPAAVAAGNVETSTRVVDVVMGALAQAAPDLMPAMSHGSMNNIAMGHVGDEQQTPWDYYETIGGGMGASSSVPGLSAVQTHMTNTLNTPVEVLESHYPLRVIEYAVRRGSGGEGSKQGGDGIIREYEFTHAAQFTLLTERRQSQPQGAQGGRNGERGINYLNGKPLPDKIEQQVKKWDRLRVLTPGGGGFGG